MEYTTEIGNDICEERNDSLTIFCDPASVYEGMREEDIAHQYGEIFQEEYDAFVGFTKDYEPFKDTADLRRIVARKKGGRIKMTAFLSQELNRVGPINGTFFSNSFLFTAVDPNHQRRVLPDLEVVNFYGDQVSDVADKVEDFYRSRGWRTEVIEGNSLALCKMRLTPESRLRRTRRNGQICVYDLEDLRRVAMRLVGYDQRKLCWRRR